MPGLFYYKISSPNSPHHQRLLKEEDDYDIDSDSDDDDAADRPYRRSSIDPHDPTGRDDDGLLANSGVLSTISASASKTLRRSKKWRRKMLRRLSLALAFYGIVVMVTCLITNTYLLAGR